MNPLTRILSSVALISLVSVPLLPAADYTWKGGSDQWNDSSLFWNSSTVAWPNTNPSPDRAIFGGTAGTVTVANDLLIYANSLRFNTTAYTIAGGNANSRLVLNGTSPSVNPTIDLNNNGTSTISAILSGSTQVQVLGDRTAVESGNASPYNLVLSGATGANHTGGFRLDGALVNLQNATGFGTGTIVVDSAENNKNSFVNVTSGGTVANNFNLRAGTTALARMRNTSSATFSGNFSFHSAGEAVQFNNTSSATFSGNWFVTEGDTAPDLVKFQHDASFTFSNTSNINLANSIFDKIGSQAGELRFESTGNTLGGFTSNSHGNVFFAGSNAFNSSLTLQSTDVSRTGRYLLGSSITQTVASIDARIGGAANSVLTVNNASNVNQTFQIGGSGGTQTGIGITKTGGGILTLTDTTSNYTGVTTLNGGILSVANLAIGGAAGAIGAASANADRLVLNGGTLRYTGATASTNRNFTLGANGGTLEANGGGAVTFSGTAPAFSGSGNRALTLTGSNTAANTLAANLANPGTGATALVKDGVGSWTLTGNSTFSGGTILNAGTLVLSSRTAAGSGEIEVAGGTGRVTATTTLANDVNFTSSSATWERLVTNGNALNLGTTQTLQSNLGGVNTGAGLLDGNAGADRELSINFATINPGASNDSLRISDVFNLTGSVSDVFVLQLQVDPGLLSAASYLGWLNGGQWINAVDGNDGGTPFFAGNRAYNSGTDFNLGTYGVDTTAGTAWAVLNHNSSFAIIPEPNTSVLLLGAGGIALWLRRRLRKA